MYTPTMKRRKGLDIKETSSFKIVEHYITTSNKIFKKLTGTTSTNRWQEKKSKSESRKRRSRKMDITQGDRKIEMDITEGMEISKWI